ncbi:MAG: DUF2254 domain-containing protein [Flavitalea sp.]
MTKNFVKWIVRYFHKVKGSIAFYPAIIAIGFLLLSWIMLRIDFSDWGKDFKQRLSWLSLKDANTARVIISTIVSGILSVTVFSFSMVMIVLNQAASQMSNRVLSSMIENRFQQIVLGCYIGTIVYALFLLSTVRDINSGIYVPAISIYLLLIFTVIDIFLFIYFLDYVTKSVKYDIVIRRLQSQTDRCMKRLYHPNHPNVDVEFELEEAVHMIKVPDSGYYQDINSAQLLKLTQKYNIRISMTVARGSYCVAGTSILRVAGDVTKPDIEKDILREIDVYNGQPIDVNPDYGFFQLAEIAIKALSPGINDPGTAVISVHALGSLLAYRMFHSGPNVLSDEKGTNRIWVVNYSFADIFTRCMHPIQIYGKDDPYIREALKKLIDQLKSLDSEGLYWTLFQNFTQQDITSNNVRELRQ